MEYALPRTLIEPYSLPVRKSSLFIHGQGVDVAQEVADLFGKQRWQALGEVQFDAFQKQRFFSGKGVIYPMDIQPCAFLSIKNNIN